MTMKKTRKSRRAVNSNAVSRSSSVRETITTSLSGQVRTNIFEIALKQPIDCSSWLQRWRDRSLHDDTSMDSRSPRKCGQSTVTVTSTPKKDPKQRSSSCDSVTARKKKKIDSSKAAVPAQSSKTSTFEPACCWLAEEETQVEEDICETTFDDLIDETSYVADDNEDLPVGLPPVNRTQFQSGDVIWIRVKNYPFWPALVLKRKQMKGKDLITFIYVEYSENGQLKYKPETKRFNRKRMFCINADFNKLKAEGLASSLSPSFAISIGKVEKYLDEIYDRKLDVTQRKKAACIFFGYTTKPTTCSADGTSSCDGQKPVVQSSDVVTLLSSDVDPVVGTRHLHSVNDDKSEVPDKENEPSPSFSDEVLQRIAERQRHVNALLKFISSRKCKKHILDVHNGKTQSSFKSNYAVKRKTATGQFQLRIQGYGPLSEESQLENLQKLVKLIETLVFKSPTECPDKYIYVIRVLVPEAIVTALQHVDNLSRKDAEMRFAAGVQWTEEELQLRIEGMT